MTKITTLKNGLRIITEYKNCNNLALGVWVKTGLQAETKENNGISHFLEHMAFKGTKTKTAKELLKMIEDLGGQVNAYTSDCMTCYHINLLPQYWKAGVDFLADIIQNSIFPEEELEKERNVILQEYNSSFDDPFTNLYYTYMENGYDSALGMKTLGTRKNILNFTSNDLKKYMEKNYAAKNMVISVCGNIDSDEFNKYVYESFKNLKSGKENTFEKDTFKKFEITIAKELEQSYFLLGWNGLPYETDKGMITSIFSAILDGGMSSRLFQEVREKHGLGYIVDEFVWQHSNAGTIGVYCAVEPKDLDEAIKVCKETVFSMYNITQEELDIAKNKVLYQLAISYDRSMGQAEKNAISLLLKHKIESYEELKEKIRKITIDDVLTFVNQYITDKVSIAILEPSKKWNKI